MNITKTILEMSNAKLIISKFDLLKEKTGKDLLAKIGGPEGIVDSLMEIEMGHPRKALVTAGLLAEYLTSKTNHVSVNPHDASVYVYKNFDVAFNKARKTGDYKERFEVVEEKLRKKQ